MNSQGLQFDDPDVSFLTREVEQNGITFSKN